MFDPTRIKKGELQEFFDFVKKISNEAENPYIGLMIDPNKRTDEFALNFLHKMDYSLVKAKFFLLFPTYYHFKSSPWTSDIKLTDEIMELKTKNFL